MKPIKFIQELESSGQKKNRHLDLVKPLLVIALYCFIVFVFSLFSNIAIGLLFGIFFVLGVKVFYAFEESRMKT